MNTLHNLIEQFTTDLLQQFFREKINTFKPVEDNVDYIFEDNDLIKEKYTDIYKRGEADITNSNDLLVISVKTLVPLTDKTGKKQQFDIAKKILQEEFKDAAFFIFYDEKGNFRFSFIRAEYLGIKSKLTHFKRYTYFVSSDLTNKTFIAQISKANFNDLDSIQEAFNVEPITKEFYTQLQHWYFWATETVTFPDDAEKEKNGREIAVIRLITRLMFIWFMKVRGLIPNDLFDEDKIADILKDNTPNNSDYYKAILQNLFFATLNTKQEDRKFITNKKKHKGFSTDFGNHNVFRYQDCFNNPDKLKSLFNEIPFLNGGLFDCLDYKTKVKEERKYIDGFTSTKYQQPHIPNSLFFAETRKEDLSKFYEKSKKNTRYEVEGLINLLNRYNFTIDENEPDDIEVALDPELLGSIFENLLASYNPETSTTARKATGSFYTPREIVNYMTTESLKQYFITALIETNSKSNAKIEENIHALINSNTSENPFDEITTKTIIKLINDLRVVDPAVGSGAFPMAMLNKLVFILEKLDPQNQVWKQSQIDSVKQSVADPVVQRKLLAHIEKQFAEKNADYGRKLYLIEKCIYGVDIQQIAVEIAKLRFFISLLVDEKIDFDKPKANYGIEPLPNLDFKLMQGNSLISTFAGIDFNETEKEAKTISIDLDDPAKKLIKKFEDLKNEYLNVSEKGEKDKLLEKIEKTIINIFEEKINEHIPQLKIIEEKYATLPNKQQREKVIAEEKEKLTQKLGFDIEEKQKDLIAYTEGRKPKDFFLWNLYFAEVFTEKGGFDVVIGNPPYIRVHKQDKITKEIIKKNYFSPFKDFDIYIVFFELALSINRINGNVVFITPDKYLVREYGKNIRQIMFMNHIIELFDISRARDIFGAATYPLITIIRKNRIDNNLISVKFAKSIKNIYKDFDRIKISQDICRKNGIIELIPPKLSKILENIYSIGFPLSNIIMKNQIFCGTPRAKDYHDWKNYVVTNDNKKNTLRMLVCSNLKPFRIKHNKKVRTVGLSITKPYFHKKGDIISNKQWKNFLFTPKILIRGNDTRITAVLDDVGSVFVGIYGIKLEGQIESKGNFLLALLNSKLYQWIFLVQNPSIKIGGDYFSINSPHILRLPFCNVKHDIEKIISKCVNQILTAKKANPEADTTELEREIDLLVYGLYELTYEEVKIVDPDFALSKESYEKRMNNV